MLRYELGDTWEDPDAENYSTLRRHSIFADCKTQESTDINSAQIDTGVSAILVKVPEGLCLFVSGFFLFFDIDELTLRFVREDTGPIITETLLRRKDIMGSHTRPHSSWDQYDVGLVEGWTHGPVGDTRSRDRPPRGSPCWLWLRWKGRIKNNEPPLEAHLIQK